MFDHLVKNIENISSLQQIDDLGYKELENEFPGIPRDYLNFLKAIGYGNLGDIQLYEGPVPPSSIYGQKSVDNLDSLVVFGDDFQGYCFAFDKNDCYRIVELSPRGEIDKTVERSFIKLLEGYFG
jgi:hypothetical protein